MAEQLTTEKSKAYIYLIGGVVAIVVLIIVIQKFFGGFDKLLEMIGLKDDAETKEAKEENKDDREESQSPDSPWSSTLHDYAPAGTLLFSRANALKLAGQIFAGIGFIYDTPSQILAAFKQCTNQMQISQIADIFAETYKRELYNYLYIGLDTPTQVKTLQQINNYVDNLPRITYS